MHTINRTTLAQARSTSSPKRTPSAPQPPAASCAQGLGDERRRVPFDAVVDRSLAVRANRGSWTAKNLRANTIDFSMAIEGATFAKTMGILPAAETPDICTQRARPSRPRDPRILRPQFGRFYDVNSARNT
jgi:hypothetical protein